jgi:SAM-dependent methyltransferase
LTLPAAIVADLVCPDCRLPVEAEPLSLRCRRCNREYPVLDGVPCFARALGSQEQTSRSFGFQWQGFWKGLFDRADVYGVPFDQTRDYFLQSLGLRKEEIEGSKVLDAGTGSGRIPHALDGLHCHVYAVDIHDGLPEIARRLSHRADVTVFQADLLRLPFRDAVFEVVWSSGVLHHTPDTRAAFRSIARTLKPGGRIFVWLYGTELNHYRLFRHLLPFAHRLPAPVVYALSAILAVPLYLAFNLILAGLRLASRGAPPPYRFLGFTMENLGYKTYAAVLLNLFDQLHPRYQHEHAVDEVRRWFEDEGLVEIVVTEASNTALRATKPTR